MPGRFRQQFGFGAVQHKRASAEMKHTVHCWCGPPNEVLTSVFVDLGELCRSVIFVTDSSRVTGIQFIYRVSEAVSLFEERAMQFHLETDELKLLANVLLEQDPRQYNELLNKVMARDLRFDSGELEQTNKQQNSSLARSAALKMKSRGSRTARRRRNCSGN